MRDLGAKGMTLQVCMHLKVSSLLSRVSVPVPFCVCKTLLLPASLLFLDKWLLQEQFLTVNAECRGSVGTTYPIFVRIVRC